MVSKRTSCSLILMLLIWSVADAASIHVENQDGSYSLGDTTSTLQSLQKSLNRFLETVRDFLARLLAALTGEKSEPAFKVSFPGASGNRLDRREAMKGATKKMKDGKINDLEGSAPGEFF
ncbi:hypothetical protein M8J77_002311 [Diaphorina citri]|nr:hypothetical protein M8J77_002311 [Diaphorina citri]